VTSRNRRSGDFRIGEVGFEPDRMVTIRGLAASPARKEPSSLSFHLAQLVHAGLITQRRLSRQLIYSAEYGAMNELLAYLTEPPSQPAYAVPEPTYVSPPPSASVSWRRAGAGPLVVPHVSPLVP
jgi:hypothetical protein